MKSCVGNEETFDKQEQQNGNESMSSHLFIYNDKWGIKSSSILLEMGNLSFEDIRDPLYAPLSRSRK